MIHSSTAQEALQTTFGYAHFRGNQEAIINSVLSGQDTLVIMPTGGGKSICYQLPALLQDGLTLVVSPLIALMEDQVLALKQLGIEAEYLNSTLDPEQKYSLFQAVNSGRTKILYLAPERLMQPTTLSWLAQLPVDLIAIDEAHCVCQWGHDFRVDYLQLGSLAEHFPNTPRIALTATATPQTQEEIVANLNLHEPKHFVASFDRPNIHYSVQPRKNGRQQLLSFLSGRRDESGVVYCLSRKRVEETADYLQKQGFNALPYHAGLAKHTRSDHLLRFLREDGVIMVATIAFGMGIDKPDVRFVCHLDLPKSTEAYYQETGRAGRDGEPAEAWMVYGLNDVVQLQQMVDDSGLNEERKMHERSKLNALLGWCEVTDCRRRSLLAYFGEEMNEACGNCDTCATTPPKWDATTAAQKLLSCILRTGQRFGSTYIIDVLLGKSNQRIIDNGHEQLSTHGIGKDLSVTQWRSVLRQLIVRNFVFVDTANYGALRVAQNAKPLLKSEQQLFLRKDLEEKRAPRREKFTQSNVSPSDAALWEKLRQCRTELAKEHELPAYQVFHDAALMEMMELKPTSEHEMLQISGVGQAKFDRYGERFLAVIKQHCE
ncbi:DNA helicase RecQ [Halioxenophilus aromaticivorans]|uniref:DNA helicase RecQ n=1 Tax=Halioxenophilus aromaticivorans TaxID=1306992 RepID=A0AAV3TX84_9ALTE